MKWAPLALRALVTAFARATGQLRGVEAPKIFGHPALFVNGNMIAGFVRDRREITPISSQTTVALRGESEYSCRGVRTRGYAVGR